MKANLIFRDQLNEMSAHFERWNDCERTVVVYSLFKQLGPPQTRFLIRALEQSLEDNRELPLLEQAANSPAFVSSLFEGSTELAISSLLSHLPLLCPGNNEAKAQYLKLLPQVFTHSITTGAYAAESRQLLSYALMHPALSKDERLALNMWLPHLGTVCNCSPRSSSFSDNIQGVYGSEQNYGNQSQQRGGSPQFSGSRLDCWKNCPVPPTGSEPSLISQQQLGNSNGHVNGCNTIGELPQLQPKSGNGTISFASAMALTRANNQVSYFLQQTNGGLMPVINDSLNSSLAASQNQGNSFQSRVRRSNSLTPPTSSNAQGPLMDEMPMYCKQRSMSLSSEHAPLSPQSSLASSGSGSESHLDEPKTSFNTEGSGMKDVPTWLKGLRLHKYANLFANMTYEDMLNLTEDKLENVTIGARHKIILSIQKLKERQDSLRMIEKIIIEGGSIRNALNELRSILTTPIKANKSESDACQNGISSDCDSGQAIAEGDLLGQFTRVVGKVCTQLLVSSRPDDDNFSQFLLLVDKCLSHESFSQIQKKRFLSWRQQVQKVWNPLPPRRGSDVRHNRGRWNGHSGTENCIGGNGGNYMDFVSVGCTENGGGIPNLTRRRVSGPFILQGSNNSSSQNCYQQPIAQPQRHMSPKHLEVSPLDQFSQHRASVGMIQGLYNKRPSLQDIKCHGSLTRTKSAPVRPQFGKHTSEFDPEMNNRLESLCLSVTEHALGSLG